MLMFDSLNKQLLSAYGSDRAITPNFQRLRERTVRFDNFFVGSMPCMPARRELHTGRYNFLHRGWSPLEPFDDSVPEILKKNGIHSHLVTDHKHYWRDGGATYHSRYSTFEFVRGQEGDAWKGVVEKPEYRYESGEPSEIKQRRIASRVQHQINVQFMQNEEDHHLARTIGKGLEFLETNHASDNWFLQLECFDPHEPFFVPEKYLKMYGIDDPSQFDGWPPYYFVTETDERKSLIQKYYMALLTMVDAYVGKVLDYMDRYDLWQDTLLIVNTDHGFLLGEHEWWGKILCRCITKWRISPALSGIRSAVVPENRGSRWHRPSISGDAAGLLRAGSTGGYAGPVITSDAARRYAGAGLRAVWLPWLPYQHYRWPLCIYALARGAGD
jgi:arylsulfatase A-like enzyme